MADENPKRIRSDNRSMEHSRPLIGSRQEVSSTTNAEMPANSRPKKK